MTVGTPGFRYREGAAPFGDLEILTPHTEGPGDNMPAAMLVMTGSIAEDAWTQSEWLRAQIGEERCSSIRNSAYSPLKRAFSHDAIHGFFLREYCLAVAVRKSPSDDRDFTTLSADWLIPSSIIGYGTGKLDVSGNLIARTYKRLFHPEKEYGKISNINVDPEFQGQGIGAALLYAVLRMLPEEKKSTVYAARANHGLIVKLGELGYRETGSQPRYDLVEGAAIEEVRLQADSVGDVRQRLVHRYAWLDNAEEIE